MTWKQFFYVMTQLRWLAIGNYYSPNKCQRAKREMENIPGANWSWDSTEPGGKAAAVRLQMLAIVKVGKHDFFLFRQLDEWWKYKIILKDGISYWVFRSTVVFSYTYYVFNRRPSKNKVIKFEKENVLLTFFWTATWLPLLPQTWTFYCRFGTVYLSHFQLVGI